MQIKLGTARPTSTMKLFARSLHIQIVETSLDWLVGSGGALLKMCNMLNSELNSGVHCSCSLGSHQRDLICTPDRTQSTCPNTLRTWPLQGAFRKSVLKSISTIHALEGVGGMTCTDFWHAGSRRHGNRWSTCSFDPSMSLSRPSCMIPLNFSPLLSLNSCTVAQARCHRQPWWASLLGSLAALHAWCRSNLEPRCRVHRRLVLSSPDFFSLSCRTHHPALKRISWISKGWRTFVMLTASPFGVLPSRGRIT